MIVYLAGAIDLVDGEERNRWREMFGNALEQEGFSTFNPASAFRYIPQNKKDAQTLIDINRHAMMACDFTVVVMGKNAPSIGTPIELYMLQQAGKSHVVVWEPELDMRPSKSSSDKQLPAYVQGLAGKVVHSFHDALNHIKKYREGYGSMGTTISAGILSAPIVKAREPLFINRQV